MRSAALIGALTLLAGCAGQVAIPTTNAPIGGPPASSTPPSAPVRSPSVMRAEGLDGVIGQRASALTSRFGQARIDLAEGDARKLQFISERCVLDIYLYPMSSGAEPVATHIEARERRGGADTDRRRCIREVEQR